jgi:enamine deaminase RidA (YjgF/YER057c/UK114 family)
LIRILLILPEDDIINESPSSEHFGRKTTSRPWNYFGGLPKPMGSVRAVNGCSDLLVEVFGETGRHARSAVGVSGLPENISVDIEAIFEVAPL